MTHAFAILSFYILILTGIPSGSPAHRSPSR
jgi:hypothetical protein